MRASEASGLAIGDSMASGGGKIYKVKSHAMTPQRHRGALIMSRPTLSRRADNLLRESGMQIAEPLSIEESFTFPFCFVKPLES
jgi:hypothetical protein